MGKYVNFVGSWRLTLAQVEDLNHELRKLQEDSPRRRDRDRLERILIKTQKALREYFKTYPGERIG